MHHKKKEPKTAADLVEHFQKRCLERIGILLSQRVLKTLLAERKLKWLGKQSNTRTIFKCDKDIYNGKQMLQFDVLVVYDKLRHTFVTTWRYDPKEWLEKRAKLQQTYQKRIS